VRCGKLSQGAVSRGRILDGGNAENGDWQRVWGLELGGCCQLISTNKA